MPRFASTRPLLAFVLAASIASLAASSLAAAPQRSRQAERRPSATAVVSADLFGRLRGILSSLWAEVGCGIDPDGRCTAATINTPPSPKTDIGCGIDPSGNCR
jgi:hypothetical protein